MHEFFIPRWRPAALNQFIGAHWSKGAALKRQDKHMVFVYGRAIPKATTKRRVHLHIILGPGQRKRDPDAYWKSLLDALTHAKLLIDDNDAGCELAPVTYERSSTLWGSRIALVDL